MAHYDLNDWTNLALGDLPEDREDEMRRHLAEGCASCAGLEAIGRELTEVTGARMGPVHFPEPVLWAAKLILGEADGQHPRLPNLPVELVFASRADLAGVRTGRDPDSWHGVYRAGDLSVDLRLELNPRRGRVSVFGQIADSEDPPKGLPHLVACLKVDDDIVARAMTNETGEFSMDYDARSAPELRVGIPEQGLFAVTLDPTFASSVDDDWALTSSRPGKGALHE